MCQQLIAKTKMVCGHHIESEGAKIPCKDKCGDYKLNHSAGMTTKREPCDDCIETGVWLKNADGKWAKA